MWKRAAVLAVAVVVLGGVIAAVVAFGRGADLAVDGPVVAHDPGPADTAAAGMAAIVGGVLERDGQCVYLSGDVVIWPAGTTWDEAESAVQVGRGGPLVREGELVTGGGGLAAQGPGEVEAYMRTETGQTFGNCLTPRRAVVVFNVDSRLKVGRRANDR